MPRTKGSKKGKKAAEPAAAFDAPADLGGEPKKKKPSLFTKLDIDGDGVLTQAELQTVGISKETFQLMDADNSGAVDKKEFRAWRKANPEAYKDAVDQATAAIKIQAKFRGHQARKEVKERKKKTAARDERFAGFGDGNAGAAPNGAVGEVLFYDHQLQQEAVVMSQGGKVSAMHNDLSQREQAAASMPSADNFRRKSQQSVRVTSVVPDVTMSKYKLPERPAVAKTGQVSQVTELSRKLSDIDLNPALSTAEKTKRKAAEVIKARQSEIEAGNAENRWEKPEVVKAEAERIKQMKETAAQTVARLQAEKEKQAAIIGEAANDKKYRAEGRKVVQLDASEMLKRNQEAQLDQADFDEFMADRLREAKAERDAKANADLEAKLAMQKARQQESRDAAQAATDAEAAAVAAAEAALAAAEAEKQRALEERLAAAKARQELHSADFVTPGLRGGQQGFAPS